MLSAALLPVNKLSLQTAQLILRIAVALAQIHRGSCIGDNQEHGTITMPEPTCPPGYLLHSMERNELSGTP